MAYKDFFIYTDQNILRTTSTTEYRVEHLLCPKELKPSIRACKEELDLEGAQSIFKNFDPLFSVIVYFDQLEYEDLHYVFDEILVRNLNSVGSFFINYGDIEDIPTDMRNDFKNIIKMTIYLFVEFVNSFNTKIDTDYKLILLETKGRNKKQDMIQKHLADYNWNWEDKMSKGFEAIYSILSINITQLYDPPYVDHTLVSYIASCCYVQLENPSISFVRTKMLRDSIMRILMILITDYDHAQNFKTKVVELLKLYEHLSLPLAKLVLQVVASENNRTSLIELIVKEIAESGEMEFLKDTSSQEISSGKSFCTFLVEIAKHRPKLILSNIDHLLPCLESDPYSMRICVLSVLKELIIHVLNNDELDEQERKTRNDYLFILQDHSLDINAFVRSKVLQLFTSIVVEDCLPKNMYKVVLSCAEEKLHDKSAYVTKSAIQLIKTLIKLNPYSSNFIEKNLSSKLDAEKLSLKTMKQVLEEKLMNGNNKEETWSLIETPLLSFLEKTFGSGRLESFDHSEKLEVSQLYEVFLKIKRQISLHEFNFAIKLILQGKETFTDELLFEIQDENKPLPEQWYTVIKNIWWYTIPLKGKINENVEQMSAEEITLEIHSTESKILYLQECCEYLDIIKKSLNTACKLMFGNTISESLEAISFLTTAHQFGVPHTQSGLDAMLTLIYSPESSIKNAIMSSYENIYLTIEENKDSTTRATIIMTRLVNLLKKLNITNRKAFKVLLNEWVKNKILDDDCIMLLWAWFTKSVPVSHEDRIAITLFISFLVSEKPGIAIGNLDSLIQYGLCDNYQLFIYTCQILEQISNENFNRFADTHEMVNRALNITLKCFEECNVQLFNDIASSAINIIYKLTIKPDDTCRTLMIKLYESMKNKRNKHPGSNQKNEAIEFDADLFAKFIFVLGHIAFQQYNHLEDYVAKELFQLTKIKYQKENSENKNNAENIHDSEAIELEKINEKIQHICNKQLIRGNGILSLFSIHVLQSCDSNHLDLKANAITTIIKYMWVSSSFCEKYLPVYVDLIEKSDNMEISIDLITGFGWLVIKHPNLMGPFQDKLYARLKDKCVNVRYSALLTIIDLLRQEMIKVNSHVAGIARMLVDENEKIKYTAKQFFGVIAEKGNTLYNILSDIISILSNPKDRTPENDFQEIIKFLLPFIDKERQLESLVDKLCKRLKESNDDIQESYLSYCLLLIKYTDKTLTKLSDNISLYFDKMKNPKVYNNFNIIISTNSRMVKPTTKEILSELNDKIEKIVKDEYFAVPHPQKTPRKNLNTTKKREVKSTYNKNESLQIVKQSAKYRTNVKRKLLDHSYKDNSSKELENGTNYFNKSNEDSNEVNVFKRTTRQMRNESNVTKN